MSLTNLTHLFRIWGAELLSEIAAVQLRSEGLFPKFDGNWFLLIGFEGLPWWWWWCNQIHINPQNLYLCICIFMYLYIDVFVYWCIYILMCLYIDVFVFVYSCWSNLPLPEIHFNPWNTFYIYSPPLPPPLLKLGCGLSAFNNLHRFCEFTFYAEQTAEKTQADMTTCCWKWVERHTLKIKRASWYFWSKS